MTGYRTKSRETLVYPDLPLCEHRAFVDGAQASYGAQAPLLWRRQNTLSRGNPGPYHVNRGDRGGNFRTTQDTVICKAKTFHLTNGPKYVYYTYDGPLFAYKYTNPAVDYATMALDSSKTFLETWGANAISRVEPTSPHASLATIVGETVKDGLPKMVGWSLQKAGVDHPLKGAGGEYLNYQFGLAPVINDIRSLYESLRDASRIMDQFARDSGKVVRRSYSLPAETSYSSQTSSGKTGVSPALNANLYEPGYYGSYRTQEDRISRERWFEGAFTYLLPSAYGTYADTFKNMARTINRVSGVLPTPEVLWELMPWSWAIDWFINVQTMLHNFWAFQNDGLILRYGYVMEHTLHDRTWTLPDVRLRGLPPRTFVQTFRRETKVRYQATPFGFGLSWDGFSPRQLAIAAALGITRR